MNKLFEFFTLLELCNSDYRYYKSKQQIKYYSKITNIKLDELLSLITNKANK